MVVAQVGEEHGIELGAIGAVERERAGTPGVLQTLKAALALELKSRIGVERIEAREQELIGRALGRCRQ